MDERAEKKETRRRRHREAVSAIERRDFVRAAITTKQGRSYLFWLMELGQIGRNPYTNNALNTAFQCGELNVSQQVLAHLIEVSPEGYLQILKEKELERLDDERRGNTTDPNSDADTDSDADSSTGQPNA